MVAGGWLPGAFAHCLPRGGGEGTATRTAEQTASPGATGQHLLDSTPRRPFDPVSPRLGKLLQRNNRTRTQTGMTEDACDSNTPAGWSHTQWVSSCNMAQLERRAWWPTMCWDEGVWDKSAGRKAGDGAHSVHPPVLKTKTYAYRRLTMLYKNSRRIHPDSKLTAPGGRDWRGWRRGWSCLLGAGRAQA